MTETQTEAPVADMQSAQEPHEAMQHALNSVKPMSQKEKQEQERLQKENRKNYLQAVEDLELQVRYSTANAEMIVQQYRAMKAYLDVEATRPEYIKVVKSKEAASAPPQESGIVSPGNLIVQP